MFALAALIVFALALFDVRVGDLDLVTLGLALVAAHLLMGSRGMWPLRRG